MSMQVLALPCCEGEFSDCDVEPVRRMLSPYIEEFVYEKLVWLELGSGYEIGIHPSEEQDSRISGFSILRADHHPELWAVLLQLSDEANMLLMGDALGAIGCLAANQSIADEMPSDTRQAFGTPFITTDPEEALAAIEG